MPGVSFNYLLISLLWVAFSAFFSCLVIYSWSQTWCHTLLGARYCVWFRDIVKLCQNSWIFWGLPSSFVRGKHHCVLSRANNFSLVRKNTNEYFIQWPIHCFSICFIGLSNKPGSLYHILSCLILTHDHTLPTDLCLFTYRPWSVCDWILEGFSADNCGLSVNSYLP